MEVLFFLLFIANVNLVRSDDNVAMESNLQETYKVYQEAEDSEDEASRKGAGEHQNEVHDGRQNQFHINIQNLKYSGDGQFKYSHVGENDHQQIHHQVVLPNDSGHKMVLNNIQGVHPGSHLVYAHPQQQMYLHQTHPQVQILGAAHLQGTHEDHGHQKVSGYSSYVEHLSKKEDEEIKSALQEGSVGDIKRLVPKSGISFKIYHTNEPGQDPGTHQYLGNQEEHLQNSRLRHKLKVEAPVQVQTVQHQLHQLLPQSVESHHFHTTNEISQQHVGSYQSDQVVDGSQGIDVKDTYHTQIQATSPKPPLHQLGGEGSTLVDPYHNLQHGDSAKQISTVELNKNMNSITGSKIIKSKEGFRKEITKFQYKKPSNSLINKPEMGLKKTIKHVTVRVKPVEATHAVHHDSINSYAGATKNGLSTYVSHSTASPVVGIEAGKSVSLAHSTAAPHVERGHDSFLTHSTAGPYVSIKPGKSVHGSLMSHTTAAPHVDTFKSSLNSLISHSAVGSYLNTEAGKSGHGGLMSHTTASPHVEPFKNSVNSFTGHATAGSYVSIGSGQSGHGALASHATAGPHVSVELIKNGPKSLIGQPYESSKAHATSFVTHSHADSEAAKTAQNHFVKELDAHHFLDTEILKSHVPVDHKMTTHEVQNTYIDSEGTKASQNNFDHQKALEGSTSFDIKNAIGNTEDFAHQSMTVQTLPYLMPKYPVPTLGNHLHGTPLLQDFPHEFLYPAVSLPVVHELSGKYLKQPQTVWTLDHCKHGNDLHQPLVRLHLSKEEPLRVKHPNVQLPTSFLTHTSYPHAKPPSALHQPFVKYTQDVHFQPKNIRTVRANNLKLLPMSVPDWNFYKTKIPNLNPNAVLVKPDLMAYSQDSGKKIIPILMKKRKNRSNNDLGVIYGKVNGGHGPMKPSQRREKNVGGNLQPEPSNQVKTFEMKNDRKNEFSVSASYQVDRSLRNVGSS